MRGPAPGEMRRCWAAGHRIVDAFMYMVFCEDCRWVWRQPAAELTEGHATTAGYEPADVRQLRPGGLFRVFTGLAAHRRPVWRAPVPLAADHTTASRETSQLRGG